MLNWLYLQYKSSRHKRSIIRIIFVFIGTILGWVWAILRQKGFNGFPLPGNVTPGEQAILVSLFVSGSGFWLSDLLTSAEVSESVDEIKILIPRIVAASSRIITFEDANEAAAYIIDAIRLVHDVRNTLVADLSDERLDESYVGPINDQVAHAVEEVVIRNNGSWRDLLGPNNVSRKDAVTRLIGKKRNYTYRVCHFAPIMNFIILNYKDKSRDPQLFFGFGLHKMEPSGHVYMTSDRSLVETFGRYYESLWEQSQPAAAAE